MQLTNHDKNIIEKVKLYLDQHTDKRFKIADLSLKYNINRTRLCKAFSTHYQTSIYQYHLKRVMGYALEAIQNGMSIKEVSYKLGYSDPASFSRAFKQVHLKPPEFFKYLVICFYITNLSVNFLLLNDTICSENLIKHSANYFYLHVAKP